VPLVREKIAELPEFREIGKWMLLASFTSNASIGTTSIPLSGSGW
jgi:hypothetical protein